MDILAVVAAVAMLVLVVLAILVVLRAMGQLGSASVVPTFAADSVDVLLLPLGTTAAGSGVALNDIVSINANGIAVTGYSSAPIEGNLPATPVPAQQSFVTTEPDYNARHSGPISATTNFVTARVNNGSTGDTQIYGWFATPTDATGAVAFSGSPQLLMDLPPSSISFLYYSFVPLSSTLATLCYTYLDSFSNPFTGILVVTMDASSLVTSVSAATVVSGLMSPDVVVIDATHILTMTQNPSSLSTWLVAANGVTTLNSIAPSEYTQPFGTYFLPRMVSVASNTVAMFHTPTSGTHILELFSVSGSYVPASLGSTLVPETMDASILGLGLVLVPGTSLSSPMVVVLYTMGGQPYALSAVVALIGSFTLGSPATLNLIDLGGGFNLTNAAIVYGSGGTGVTRVVGLSGGSALSVSSAALVPYDSQTVAGSASASSAGLSFMFVGQGTSAFSVTLGHLLTATGSPTTLSPLLGSAPIGIVIGFQGTSSVIVRTQGVVNLVNYSPNFQTGQALYAQPDGTIVALDIPPTVPPPFRIGTALSQTSIYIDAP